MDGITNNEEDFVEAIQKMQKLRSSKTIMKRENSEEEKFAAAAAGLKRTQTFRTVTKSIPMANSDA